jgi:hypothetical protein
MFNSYKYYKNQSLLAQEKKQQQKDLKNFKVKRELNNKLNIRYKERVAGFIADQVIATAQPI